MRLLITILLALVVLPVYSLKLADFVPEFLQPGSVAESAESSGAKSLAESKHAATTDNSWYCNRFQGTKDSSVFCKNNLSEPALSSESVVGNGIATNSIQQAVQPNSNQYALQSQQTRAVLNNSNNFSLPLQPSRDVNLSVGQQQVEVNIKY